MRNKQDLLFIVVGVLLFSVLMLTVFYSISFLISKINAALSIEVENNHRLIRIDLESLKNIQITEEAENEIETKEETNGALEENTGI